MKAIVKGLNIGESEQKYTIIPADDFLDVLQQCCIVASPVARLAGSSRCTESQLCQ